MSMKLFESVSFDSPTQFLDGQGGVEKGWTRFHSCRAHFRYLRGGETVQQARLTGRQPVVVTIWRCTEADLVNVASRMRDERRGDVYNVRSIVPSDDRLKLELTCERGVPV